MIPLLRRGDSTTNVIIFLTVVIAGFILVAWYMTTVQPARYNIGAVTEDITEINQHLTNACASTVYRATYRPAARGVISVNTTHLCVATESFGSCKTLPCAVIPGSVMTEEDTIVRIEKADERITLRTTP
jgi:hypothetical protein